MAVSDNARDEIRALRNQVNQLMEDRVSPAYAEASKRAGKYLDNASDYASDYAGRARAYAGDGADYVSDHVRDQPLIAIGVAAAVGFLFGRISK